MIIQTELFGVQLKMFLRLLKRKNFMCIDFSSYLDE